MKRTMGLGVMGGCMMQAVYMGIAWAEVQAKVERAQREAREREEEARGAAKGPDAGPESMAVAA